MGDRFTVTVGAGSLRSTDGRAVQFPHRWTPEGVTVEAVTGRTCFILPQRAAS